MNNLTSQQRKLVYFATIIVLLIPIIMLGMPGSKVDGSGGTLSKLRREHKLGESTLGKVDPSGAAMNLVLLGLRGVAVNVLWQGAIDHQEKKEWGKLRSLVDSVVLLQPHFQAVWRFQSWNLAYNVSAAWDDVEDRFYWVKEGIKFCDTGTQRNQGHTELFWDLGRFTGPKIGNSDEWRHFRQYFMSDPDPEFEGRPDPKVNPAEEDNYLRAKTWWTLANEKELIHGQHVMARVIFRKYPVQALFDYANVLERLGLFEERTSVIWRQAFDELTQIYGQELFHVKVGAIDTHIQMESTEETIQRLAKEYGLTRAEQLHWTSRYQKTVNYNSWRQNALASSDELTMGCHRDLYDGRQLFKLGRTNPRYVNSMLLIQMQRPFTATWGHCGGIASVAMGADVLAATETSVGEEFGFSEVAVASEARAVLEQGMRKFMLMLQKYPELKTYDQTIEEGLLATEFWLAIYTLNRGDNAPPVPAYYPMKEYREDPEYQPRMPTVRTLFQRETAGE